MTDISDGFVPQTNPLAKSTGTGAHGKSHRALALDALRGLVIVLMALDHTRDFFTRESISPTDLDQTTTGLFLTRWITHFCAPVFVFLAGMGIFLGGMHHSLIHHARYLLIRGFWLILLEFTLVKIGWSFNLDYAFLVGQVIWAIGCSMVTMAALIFLPSWAVVAIGLTIVFGHNLLDEWTKNPEYRPWLVSLQLRPGFLAPWKLGGLTTQFIIPYPFLPWLGIMAMGYGCGDLYHRTRQSGKWIFLVLGLVMTGFFFFLRLSNGYGDPGPRIPSPEPTTWILSFINCTKYPPSLDYTLMTLGPALLLIWAIDGKTSPALNVLATFGRVPLFVYLIHVPVIHLGAMAAALVRHGRFDFLLGNPLFGREAFPPDYGYGLPGVYLAWIMVVILLYPMAQIFSQLKKKGQSAIWRLF